MSNKPMFVKKNDEYLVSPAGVVLMAAEALHGDPKETTPLGRQRAQALIREALSTAMAFGYKHSQIAETVLSGRDPARKAAVAQEIAGYMNADTFEDVLRRAGWRGSH